MQSEVVERIYVPFDLVSLDFHLNQWTLAPWDRASIDNQCGARHKYGSVCTKDFKHSDDHVAHSMWTGAEMYRWRNDAE